MAKLFDQGQYVGDALTCFGVDIAKDSTGKWGAVANQDPANKVDTLGSKYQSTDCVKSGNLDWLRVRYFIFDTHTMEAYACYQNIDDQSCTDSGIVNTTTTSPTTGTTTTNAPVTGTANYGAAPEQLQGLPDSCKTGTATGSIKFLCVGAKYRDKAQYISTHTDSSGKSITGKDLSMRWAAGERDTLPTDCSMFISTVLWDAYGVDYLSDALGYVGNTTLFKQISIADAKPGDFAVDGTGGNHHIAIVVTPGQTRFDASEPKNNPPDGLYLHPGSGGPGNGVYQSDGDVGVRGWEADGFTYALRYIGPGSTP